MPTRKPRIAVTLPEGTADALNDLADALKRPASTLAAEFLTELAPMIQGLAKMARHAAAGNKSAAKRALTHAVGRELAGIIEAVGKQEAAEQRELFASKRRAARERAKARKAAAS